MKSRDPRWLVAGALVVWAAYVVMRYAPNHRETARLMPLGAGVVSALVCGLVVFVAATSLGAAVLSRLHPIEELPLRVLTSMGIGTGLLGTIVFLLGAVGQVSQWPVVGVVVLSFAAGARELGRDARALVAAGPPRPIVLGLAAPLVVLSVLATLTPPNDWDELAYHIPIAVHATETGHFALAAHDQSFFPSHCEALITVGLLLNGSFAVGRVLHLLFGFGLIGAVYVGSASLLPEHRWARWLSVAIVALEPVFVDEARQADVDLALAFYVVLAVIHVVRDGSWRSAVVAGACAGFACATSYRGLLAAVAIAAAALVMRRFRTFGALAAAGAVAGLPWYVRNAIVCGNPIFPFLTGVFPTRALPTAFSSLDWPDPTVQSRDFAQSAGEDHAGLLLNPLRYFELAWNATIEGRIHTAGGFSADISPVYLATVPAAVFVRRESVTRPLAAWVAFAVVHSIAWSFGVQGTRYQLPAFAAMAVCLPALFEGVRWDVVRKAAYASCALVCALLYGATLVKHIDRADTRYVFGVESEDRYLVSHADGPLFAIIAQINRKPPTRGPILMIGEKRGLYLSRRPFIPDFNLDNVGTLYRNGGGTAEGMRDLLLKNGITYIMEHSIRAGAVLTPEERRAYGEFVARFTEPAFQNNYLVWRVVK